VPGRCYNCFAVCVAFNFRNHPFNHLFYLQESTTSIFLLLMKEEKMSVSFLTRNCTNKNPFNWEGHEIGYKQGCLIKKLLNKILSGQSDEIANLAERKPISFHALFQPSIRRFKIFDRIPIGNTKAMSFTVCLVTCSLAILKYNFDSTISSSYPRKTSFLHVTTSLWRDK